MVEMDAVAVTHIHVHAIQTNVQPQVLIKQAHTIPNKISYCMFHSHFSVNCQWASWGSWQSCSKTCGGGDQKRTRTKSVVAQYGGNECSGSYTSTQSCNTNKCPGTY